MTMQFENQKYINLETFRKSGKGVKTPVWFAKEGESFYVWTQANSGKAKRIRRAGGVKITPSTASGEPVGEWVDAYASANTSDEAIQHVTGLMKKKYGLSFAMFRLMGRLRKTQHTTLKIEIK